MAFRNNIEECKLHDLGTSGPKFTWRGFVFQGGQCIYDRLDRALSDKERIFMFPEAHIKVLARVEFYDHHPIMISNY